MATGRRIVINHDKNGFGVMQNRRCDKRHFNSDRRKGARKMLNQTIRTQLKREAKTIVERDLEN